MFTELVKGLLHIRRPLVVGYGLLLTAWIVFGDSIPARAELKEGSPAALVSVAFEGMGSAARTAALSFVALLIGSASDRVFFQEFVKRSPGSRRKVHPLLPLYRDHVDSLEGQLVRLTPPVLRLVPRAEGHRAELERHLEERDFRLLLSWVSACPALAAGGVGGGWYWALMAVPLFLMLDAQLVDRGEAIRLREETRSIDHDADAAWSAEESQLEIVRLINHPTYGLQRVMAEALSPAGLDSRHIISGIVRDLSAEEPRRRSLLTELYVLLVQCELGGHDTQSLRSLVDWAHENDIGTRPDQ